MSYMTYTVSFARTSNVKHHQGKIKEFVKDNIKHRQCKKYVPDLKKKESRVCQCGRDTDWHEENGINTSQYTRNEKWQSDHIYIKEVPADTFGEISFCGFGHEATIRAPYVRVDCRTSPNTVWDLLSEHWHVPPPKLLISVTGGAKQFFMKSRLLNIFKRGLINAATTTGAWIITGGTNTGVMKMVGEAVREHILSTGSVDKNQVVALGIATWGILENKEALVGQKGEGRFPANYNNEELNPKSRMAPIDPNHSHFIFVDNGTEGKYGVEISFRAHLEHFISTKLETEVSANRSGKLGVYIPVVLLVAEGGIGTLGQAAESVKKNMPIVVIQGSGRAADYIAMAYRETKPLKDSEDESVFSADFEEIQRGRAEKLFEWRADMDQALLQQQIRKCVENLKACLSNRKVVTVFHLDGEDASTKDIDRAILYALLKANRTDAQSQLNLALAWNRCDIARQEIFKQDNLANWKKLKLADVMFTALIQNRVDFVKLFLDNGVELKKFLTVERLRNLYAEVIDDSSAGSSVDLLKSLYETEEQRAWFKDKIRCRRRTSDTNNKSDLLYIVGRVLKTLLGDHYPNTFKDERFLLNPTVPETETNFSVINETPQAGHSEHIQLTKITSSRTTKNKHFPQVKPDFECPERELLMWAILLNRFELAELFWKNGKDHIGGALTGSALFKALAKHATSEEIIDLSLDLEKNSQAFEQLAIGVLGECFLKDKYLCQNLLVRELEHWGNTTVLGVAESAELMDFMEHSACQTKLNIVWKGNMALYTSYWKIMLAMFLPVFVPLIKFSRKPGLDPSANEFESDDNAVFENESVTEMNASELNDNTGAPNNNGKQLSRAPTVKGKLRQPLLPGNKKLHSVNLTGRGRNKISLFYALHYYYVAPVTKFMYNIVSSLIFLALFSYFLLIDLCPVDNTGMTCVAGPSVVEYITWCWCMTLIFEEIRQVFVRDPRSVRYKVMDWFSNVWNKFDLAVYLLFILSVILRLVLKGDAFTWARISYSLTLSMFFLRFMHMFFVEKNIGPKVIMIRRMLTDLMFFFIILIVFILSYGVAQQALLFPNSPPSWTVLKEVVYQPYFRIYGELFLDTVEGKGSETCSKNAADGGERCPQEVWIVPILLALYMILTNVLLLNLLIAMFSYTFQKVQDNSEKVWRFYRYSLIYEYLDRPAIAPPLIIFNHIIRTVMYFVNRCRKNVDNSTHLNTKLCPEEQRILTAFEREGMEKYLIHIMKMTRENIDSRVATTGERIEKVIEDLEEIKEQVNKGKPQDVISLLDLNRDAVDGQSTTIHTDLEQVHNQLAGLENKLQKQLQTQQQQFELILKALEENKHSISHQPVYYSGASTDIN